MPIELVITDETPEQPPAAGLSEQEILDCFLGAELDGSYRQYLLRAGRAIEAKLAGRRARFVEDGEESMSSELDSFRRRHYAHWNAADNLLVSHAVSRLRCVEMGLRADELIKFTCVDCVGCEKCGVGA